MIANPEFRRNLWIQFSSTRVLVASLLVGLMLACAAAVDYALAQRRAFVPDVAAFVGYWLTIVILLFWAGHQSAGTVLREIRGRTWDAQRLSTLHPWSMTWAKLFGSTSLAWLMALICAAAYVAADFLRDRSATSVFVGVAVLFGYGLLCQATGMLGSLARLSGRPGERGGGTTLAHAVALIATGLLTAFVYWALENQARWFGIEIGPSALTLLTIWFFALWAVVGVYRRMRRELQMRSLPWAWLLFLITFVIYGEGLAYGRGQPELALILPGSLLALMLWAVTLIEAKDPLSLRQSLQRIGRGRLRDGLTLVPLWLVTYIVFAIAIAVCCVLAASGTITLRIAAVPGVYRAETLMILLGLFFFLTRDLLIVLILTLGREGNLAGVGGAMLWFVLYVGVGGVLAAGEQTHLLGLALPTGQGGWLIAVLPAAIQAALCLVLFIWRWRVYWRENAAKAPVA